MAELELTVKRMTRLDTDGPTKAFCDVAINESFVIKSLKVVFGKKGFFVSMPREQGRNGQWYEMVSPLNQQARDRLHTLVLGVYQQKDGTSE